MNETKRVIVGISGASGAIYGVRALELLREVDVETHLVISPAGRLTIHHETNWKGADVEALADVVHDHRNVGASIASGSFETVGMVVAPCSVKTMSNIANMNTGDLISRAADVTLKEGRRLILMFRETPLHLGHLRLLAGAAEMGAVIFPPLPVFYTHPETIDEMVTQTTARMLARLGIPNDSYRKWSGF